MVVAELPLQRRQRIEITDARLGAFQSKVTAVGPQIGYAIDLGVVQADLNLRGYKEFDAQNRPEGWNVWLTLSLSKFRPRTQGRS